MDINDFPPGTKDISGLLALFQTTGSGTPASTTYSLALLPWIVALLGSAPRSVLTGGGVTLSDTDFYVPCKGTTPIVINPPASPIDGQLLLIKDWGKAATTGLVSLGNGSGSWTVDGNAAPLININFALIRCRWDAAQAAWGTW